jgi:hypothetical protein
MTRVIKLTGLAATLALAGASLPASAWWGGPGGGGPGYGSGLW